MSISNANGLDPAKTFIIVGETGVYKLTADKWETPENRLDGDAAALGVVNELTSFGSYLAFVPDLAVGYGSACTIVNLKALLRAQAAQTSPEASGGAETTAAAE